MLATIFGIIDEIIVAPSKRVARTVCLVLPVRSNEARLQVPVPWLRT